MENINLDNIEVKDGEFKKYLTEDGEYVVSISGVDQGVSTNTGTPYLKFECKTENDEYINISLYLTEKAMWRFKKFIMASPVPEFALTSFTNDSFQAPFNFVVSCSIFNTSSLTAYWFEN